MFHTEDPNWCIADKKSVARAIVVTPSGGLALTQRSLVSNGTIAPWEWSLPGGKYSPHHEGPLALRPKAADVLTRELREEFGDIPFDHTSRFAEPFWYGGWQNFVFSTYARHGCWTHNTPETPRIKVLRPEQVAAMVALSNVVHALPILSWLRKLDLSQSKRTGKLTHEREKALASQLIAFNHGTLLQDFVQHDRRFLAHLTGKKFQLASQLVQP